MTDQNRRIITKLKNSSKKKDTITFIQPQPIDSNSSSIKYIERLATRKGLVMEVLPRDEKGKFAVYLARKYAMHVELSTTTKKDLNEIIEQFIKLGDHKGCLILGSKELERDTSQQDDD